MPFHTDSVEKGVNAMVLSNAPCSVAIFVDKGSMGGNHASVVFGRTGHHFAVLFLGGADSREALAYADRMLASPDVCMTVIRFLAADGHSELEKKLDDGLVTWFWVKNEANDRVVYREVVVRNGAETVAAIQAINDGSFDLWVVGRKQGINPVLLQGLSDWTENHQELGIFGDYVAAPDFGGTASVLVVQQQILREQASSSNACGSQVLSNIFGARR